MLSMDFLMLPETSPEANSISFSSRAGHWKNDTVPGAN